RRRYGDVAVTRTLVALAAGETGDARREAARARRLLGDSPQTLLLAAEAGRLAGSEAEAETAFRALTEREDGAFLGYRGLLRQAMERKDWVEAAGLARKAEAAHPGAAWLRGERAQLAIRTGAWSEALALADPDAPKAALACAAADVEADAAHGMRLARQAWTEDPSLVAAALVYARRLREAGRETRAQDVIRKTWATNPHPALADFALAPTTDPLHRVQEAKRLAQENPDHPESHLLLGQVSLAAGLTGEARRHAEAARDGGLLDRRVWLLFADIEEAEHGDTEEGRAAQRDALRQAAVAPAEPGWHCTSCGAPQPKWQAACPVCGTVGSIRWGPEGARQEGALVSHEPQPVAVPI
ncbi:MAG: heme biosynthesis protein HemY, partial [Acetobacteraceae bacterium]|nr:heme biosynthesis protein HemY [Acetobacteraceae bacterium]